MAREPIRGLSDQRYFHVALISPRRREFGTDWVWTALRKECKISAGRHKTETAGSGSLEFKIAHAPSHYVRPGEARGALSVDDAQMECAYDVFAGSLKGVLVFGTGYAALTRHLVGHLLKRELLSNAWFLAPRLREIISYCRTAQQEDVATRFTVTGFNAFVPGVKNLKVIRLGGADVFNSGFVEQIERWLKNRGRADSDITARPETPSHSLQYQAIRLKATGTLSGSTVSFGLASDGGCKMWLQKDAVNLSDFAVAVSVLKDLGKFETTTESPRWSDESDL